MNRLTVLDQVTWNGREIRGGRTAALLCALVAAGPGGLSEGALVDRVWQDRAPEHPRKALQVVVSRARAETAGEVVARTARGYRLALATGEVDAWALRPEGLRLAAEGRYAQALPLLERAARADEQGAAGPPQGDPQVVAALLRALAAVHGVPAALARYERYRARLADELGVDPPPQVRALHAELLAADRPVRTGLRFDADRLIGRDADLAAVRALLGTHRVVSIVGAGGLGKTRLVHAVARAAGQPVVHVVELAGVTSPDGVAVEVADVLGVRDSPSGRPVAGRHADLYTRMGDTIGTVPVLLVLDNCEHVVEAAADLVAVLVTRTPRLTVLTTSRMPLGLPAERVYPLAELPADEASQLFAERATAARPDVLLDPAEVRELVGRLDGLPLALELAAAKVRSLSVAEITARLDDRFALLRGGSRAAPARHQTLLAVIGWSWNLLTERQRAALRRLAVFRDGFALAGAAAVLGAADPSAGGSGDDDAEELVAALVEHSLVAVRESTVVRYRLLETVREFARMRLVEAGEEAGARRALRDWALEVCRRAGDRLNTPDQVATMASIRGEEGNLVDVLRHGLAEGDVAAVAGVFGPLSGYWMIEGSHTKVMNLGPSVVRLLLSVPTAPELADDVRACLAVEGTNEMVFGTVEHPALFDRLADLGPGTHPRVAPMARVLLESRAAGADQIARLEALADGGAQPAVARLALMWVAHVYENGGDLPSAIAAARRALALCDDSEGPWLRGFLSATVSNLAFQTGDLREAGRHAEAAMTVLRALGAHEDHAQIHTVLAALALHEGRVDDAERILDRIEAEVGVHGSFGELDLMCGRAELLLARGRVDEGLATYRATVTAIRERGGAVSALPVVQREMFTLAALVAAHVRHGRDPSGERAELLRQARGALARGGVLDVPVLGCAVFALAVRELAFGDRETGAVLLGYADRYAFNRMLPSFDRPWAVSLAQPADPGKGDPARLREPLLTVLDGLAAR